jgi:hypothetical protein
MAQVPGDTSAGINNPDGWTAVKSTDVKMFAIELPSGKLELLGYTDPPHFVRLLLDNQKRGPVLVVNKSRERSVENKVKISRHWLKERDEAPAKLNRATKRQYRWSRARYGPTRYDVVIFCSSVVATVILTLLALGRALTPPPYPVSDGQLILLHVVGLLAAVISAITTLLKVYYAPIYD